MRRRGEVRLIKTCTQCRILLPRSAFYPLRKTAIRPECKHCAIANAYRWNVNNRERHNANRALSRQRHPNAYREWAARSREYLNEVARNWRAVHAYKRSKLGNKAMPKWADKDAIEAVYKSARQKTKETGERWEVDHIVPFNSAIVCGLHVEYNLRVIRMPENRARRNRQWPDMPEGS